MNSFLERKGKKEGEEIQILTGKEIMTQESTTLEEREELKRELSLARKTMKYHQDRANKARKEVRSIERKLADV